MTYPALERFEQLARDFDGLQQRIGARVTELRAEPVQAVGDSGLVLAAVDHSGRMERVTLDPRAMRMPSEQLAGEITATVVRARDEAAARLRQAMREAVGTDVAFDDGTE